MRKLARLLVIGVVTAASVVALAPAAGAKVLPYDYEIAGTRHRVNRPVTVVFTPHPQNVLPATFDFEVRWARVPAGRRLADVVRPRAGRKIVLRQVSPTEYQGTFTPKRTGLHAVFGVMDIASPDAGYPGPLRVRVKR
jgi:hypothetical protein